MRRNSAGKEAYMLTSFDQVREWIIDNGFKRWILYKDSLRKELIIDSAGFHVSDQSDKIAMTEKYLRLSGGRAYAAGSASGSINDLNVTTEIRLDDEQATSGIGMQPNIQPLNIGEIEDRVRKQVRAELREAELSKREKDVAEREKEFEEQRNGVIGAIVGYVAPYLPILKNLQSAGSMLAGLDTEEPVHAHKVQPIIPKEETQEPETETIQEEEIFTDAEDEELFDLMKRFKAVEPENWLAMMRKMVDMAEKNDTTYQMARNFLIS